MLRRSFIQSSALSLGYLVLGFSLAEQKVVAAQTGFANAWIRVGSDNSVTMVTPRAEVGQDIYTTLPLIMAEELDFPVTKITVEQATADAAHYGNPHPIMGGTRSRGAPLRFEVIGTKCAPSVPVRDSCSSKQLPKNGASPRPSSALPMALCCAAPNGPVTVN